MWLSEQIVAFCTSIIGNVMVDKPVRTGLQISNLKE